MRETSRGGKKLTYIDKRSLSNRLGSVCGPKGWDIEFEPTGRQITAGLGIICPTFKEETCLWHYKEDGAGFEEMGSTNKTTGEFEHDLDHYEKLGLHERIPQKALNFGTEVNVTDGR